MRSVGLESKNQSSQTIQPLPLSKCYILDIPSPCNIFSYQKGINRDLWPFSKIKKCQVPSKVKTFTVSFSLPVSLSPLPWGRLSTITSIFFYFFFYLSTMTQFCDDLKFETMK